jgi:hypothetical protein
MVHSVLVKKKSDSLFKGRASSPYECDFGWFSIDLPVSVDPFLRGFLQSFSRFLSLSASHEDLSLCV